MKVKSMTLLLLAGGCGLVAMLGVQQVLNEPKVVAEEEMGQVLLATVDILAGTPLDATNTSFKQVPLSAIPEGVVTEAEQYEDRALKVRAVPGEMIMLAKLGEPGDNGVSITIPPGMRVVTVSCNTTMTHSNMLRPGDRVDILLTYDGQKNNGQGVKKTRTVLEYIKVFATDNIRDTQDLDALEVQAKNVSFLVTPEQANLLKLAESKGKVHLSLRSQTDHDAVETATVTDMDLEGESELGVDDETALQRLVGEKEDGGTEPAEPVETVTPKWPIQIYSGDKVRVEEVPLPVTAGDPWGAWLNQMFRRS